jgi:tRNA threonylcarbamoyl adenosine modification protein YeaZ
MAGPAAGDPESSIPSPQPAAVTYAARRTVDGQRHGELLAPSVRAVLEEAQVTPAELTAVVAGVGPGPYTSLRVGVVTAAAFADAAALPAYGICSLDGIGLAHLAEDATGEVAAVPVAAVTDARRREVFWAVYAGGRRTGGPAVGRPQDVADALRAAGVGRAVGPGAVLYADAFGELTDPAAVPAYPDPAVLAAVAAPTIAAGTLPSPLVPLYLRRPDAAQPHPPKPVTA